MTVAQFARSTGIPLDVIMDTPIDEFAWVANWLGYEVWAVIGNGRGRPKTRVRLV